MSQTRCGQSEKSSRELRRRLSSGYGSSSPPPSSRSSRSSTSFASSHKQQQRSRDHRHPSTKVESSKNRREHQNRYQQSHSTPKIDLRDRLDFLRHHQDRDREKHTIYGSGQVQFVTEEWAGVLCSRKNRLIIFHSDDYPLCSVGDSVRFHASYVYRDDRPSCHTDVRYHAFKIEKKLSETDRNRSESPSGSEKVDETDEVDFILDTTPLVVDIESETLRALVVKCDRRSSSRVVIDNSETKKERTYPRMSSASRERRSKRFEPTIALKNRKGIIHMEGKWPIIIDHVDGHRISLFPERFGDGREAPRDGMFVRYDAYQSAWKRLRCGYNALSAEEISKEEYGESEVVSKSSASAERRRSTHRRSRKSTVSSNEGEILRGLEGVQGTPRIQLSKDYRLAHALREVNKMRPDRQSINHECASLFEHGGVWDKQKKVFVIDISDENDRSDSASSPSIVIEEEVKNVDEDAKDSTEKSDEAALPSLTPSNIADEVSENVTESTDDPDELTSILDEYYEDVGFMVYDDEEQRLELEAYELLLKEQKETVKTRQDVADELMDIC